MTAITSGLSQGQRVVTDGADRLRAGLTVNVTTVDGKPVQPAATPPNGPGEKRNRGGKAGDRATAVGRGLLKAQRAFAKRAIMKR